MLHYPGRFNSLYLRKTSGSGASRSDPGRERLVYGVPFIQGNACREIFRGNDSSPTCSMSITQ